MEKIIDEFLKYCEEKNFRGLIVASDRNYENNYAGNYAEPPDVMLLLRNFLRNLQEKTGTPATSVATHLALSMAILDLSDAGKKFDRVDAKILEEAIKIVQDSINKELEQTRLADSKRKAK